MLTADGHVNKISYITDLHDWKAEAFRKLTGVNLSEFVLPDSNFITAPHQDDEWWRPHLKWNIMFYSLISGRMSECKSHKNDWQTD